MLDATPARRRDLPDAFASRHRCELSRIAWPLPSRNTHSWIAWPVLGPPNVAEPRHLLHLACQHMTMFDIKSQPRWVRTTTVAACVAYIRVPEVAELCELQPSVPVDVGWWHRHVPNLAVVIWVETSRHSITKCHSNHRALALDPRSLCSIMQL